MKNKISIFIIFILFLSIKSIEQIEYSINRGFLGRFIDSFSVKFNRLTGIQAQYVEARNNTRRKETYNITNDELGLPSMKELFKLFNKINFPNETNWMQQIYDVPIWHLIVDGKDYYSNRGTEFLEKFNDIVNLTNIKEYCKKRY